MRRNAYPPARIVLPEALLPEALVIPTNSQPSATAIRPNYCVERVFSRGTLIDALESDTDVQSEQVLDAFIARALPTTPFDLSSGILSPFWMKLAICNGHCINRLWRDHKKQHVNDAVKLAEGDGWLFRLPFWPLPDMPDRDPLIFFSDTGLHGRLVKRWETLEELKASQEEKIDPERAKAIRRNINHCLRYSPDLRFQGFATFALMRSVPDARPYVLNLPTIGEIDLVLDGPKGERWAIEITNGEPSGKPSNPRVFHSLCEGLGITPQRRRVLYREANASRGQAKAGVVAVTLPVLLAELMGR